MSNHIKIYVFYGASQTVALRENLLSKVNNARDYKRLRTASWIHFQRNLFQRNKRSGFPRETKKNNFTYINKNFMIINPMK